MKKYYSYLSPALVFILMITVTRSFAQPQSLDLTFSGDGVTTTAIGVYDYGRSVVIQSDGKILLVGYTSSTGSNYNIAVVRYNTNGNLDNTFGTGGIVSTDIGASTMDYGNAIALQSDGKIVAAGTTYNGSSYDVVVVRYNTNGTLDATFDTDGKVITTVGAGEDNAYAMAIQSDGKIVIGGISHNGTNFDHLVARYNADGSLDNTFGTGGIVINDIGGFEDYGSALALQSDGKIVTAGSAGNGTNDDIIVARYTTTGTLDNTFGTGGEVITAIATNGDYARSVIIQPDGKILAGGGGYTGTNWEFAIVRYTTTGALDTSFDTDGKVTTSIGSGDDLGIAIALQSDGKIVAAGYSVVAGNYDFGVARYNSNGSLDNSFDSDGKLTTDVTGGLLNDYARSVVIQPSDGKIVVGGYVDFSGNFSIAMARYCPRPSQPNSITGNASLCSGVTETYSITAVTGAIDYTWSVPAGSVINSGQGTTSISVTFGSNSGNVSVTADNDCGSSTVRTKAITVTSLPATPGTISGTTAMCEGTTQTYSISSVSGATGYTWTVPNGTVINSGQGTTSINVTIGYASGNISVTGDNTCGTSSASSLPITVTPLPYSFFGWSSTATVVTFTNLCQNATTYSWAFGDAGTSAAPSPVHNYASAGTYTVELTATNSCGTGYYTTNITITATGNGGDIGIDEMEKPLHLSVYPNPSSGMIQLDISGESIPYHHNYTIEIVNLIGESIGVFEIESEHAEIDLTNYSDGIYFLKCSAENAKGMVKVVKQ